MIYDIKTRYKFIHFIVIDPMPGRKTMKIGVMNNSNPQSCLSIIKWYPPWRKYCMFYEPDVFNLKSVMMDKSCLDDISEFLANLNQQHKELRNADK